MLILVGYGLGGMGMYGLGGMGMGMGYPYGMMLGSPYGYSGGVSANSFCLETHLFETFLRWNVEMTLMVVWIPHVGFTEVAGTLGV